MAASTDAAHAHAALAGVQLLLTNAALDGSPSADGTPWSEASRKPDLHLTIYRSDAKGSSYARFKAVCVLPHAPAVLARFVADNEARMKWDSNIARLETHALAAGDAAGTGSPPPPGAKFYLLRCQTHAVGPISARDFVDAVATYALPDGRLVNGGASVVDAARCPERKGVVRGWNTPGGGWVFEPVRVPATSDGTGARVHTRVVYVIHSDLRGWMPSSVVNAALTSTYVAFFTDLRKAMAAAVAPDEGQAEAAAQLAAAEAASAGAAAAPSLSPAAGS
jgi:hypothetical protein